MVRDQYSPCDRRSPIVAKRTLVDFLADLTDDELKLAITESRAKRSRSRLDSIIFDVPDDDEGSEEQPKKGGKGFFGD